MVYDPQRQRRRPVPADDDPVPVDALLARSGDATTQTPAVAARGAPTEDPPPDPAVTPAPADPPSDRLLLNTGLIAAVAAAVVLLLARHLWMHRRRDRTED